MATLRITKGCDVNTSISLLSMGRDQQNRLTVGKSIWFEVER